MLTTCMQARGMNKLLNGGNGECDTMSWDGWIGRYGLEVGGGKERKYSYLSYPMFWQVRWCGGEVKATLFLRCRLA